MSRAIDSPEPGGERPDQSRQAHLLALLASPGAHAGLLAGALGSFPPDQVGGLLAALSYHRVEGLASRALASLPPGVGPAWLRSTLRRRHQRISAATLSQGLALAEILESLHALRVPVAVVRGVRSVEGIYADSGARPFEDHDLLVLPSDLHRARQAFVRLGFTELGPRLHRRGGTIVDLHDDPLGACRRPTRSRLLSLTVEMLFSRASSGAVAGAPALVLGTEDELLLLAIHLVKHSFDRLIRIADLAHLVASRRASLDWGSLRARAETCRALPLLACALEATTILGQGAPERLEPARRRGLLERFLMRRALELRPVPYGGDLLMALTAPSWAAGAGFLIDALLPSGEVPLGALSKARLLPFRAAGLARRAVGQAALRRHAR
jgi:putative nucleotidyltransferase-like protein